MHTEFDAPSFQRGWVTWLLQEAVKRNPAIRVGGLAWTWPAWTKNRYASPNLRYFFTLIFAH